METCVLCGESCIVDMPIQSEQPVLCGDCLSLELVNALWPADEWEMVC